MEVSSSQAFETRAGGRFRPDQLENKVDHSERHHAEELQLQPRRNPSATVPS